MFGSSQFGGQYFGQGAPTPGASVVSHSSDANKRVAGSTRPHTTSANKRVENNTISHTTSAYKMVQTVVTLYPSLDGSVSRTGVDETFSAIRNGAGNAFNNTGTSEATQLAASATSNQYGTLVREIFSFDTSSIPDDAIINSVTFSLYGQSKANFLGTPDLHVAGATPASTSTLANSDYGNVQRTSFGAVTYAGFSTAGYNDIVLNASGIAQINTTGYTSFSTQLAWDLNDSFTGGWTNSAPTVYSFYMSEDTGTSRDPKITISYSVFQSVNHTTDAVKHKQLTDTHTTDAQLSTTVTVGPNDPATATVSSDGFDGWSTPGNIFTSDDTYATATLGINANWSNFLIATNFGFSIPAGATINGIQMDFERKAGSGASDKSIRIVKGGSYVGTDKSAGASWPAADAYATYGGSSDLWGTTWTVDDINTSNFGVAIQGQNIGGFTALYVDHVRMTVTYTPGVPVVTKTHTTDAMKHKAITVSHTTDALTHVEATSSHATDASKKVSDNTRTHTTDSNRRKATDSTHTTDTLIRVSNEVGHTTDAFKRSEITKTHTADANKRKENILAHSTDSLTRSVSTLSSTTDSVLSGINRYWVGDSGDWSDDAHWAITSGGAGGYGAPGRSRNAIFDANSFTVPSQTVTLTDARECRDLDWTGTTNNPTFDVQSTISTFGTTVTFATGMSVVNSLNNFASAINIESAGSMVTLTTNGVVFTNIASIGSSKLQLTSDCQLQLADDLTLAGDGYVWIDHLAGGSFATNNHTITVDNNWGFIVYRYDNVDLGTSTINAGSGIVFDYGYLGTGVDTNATLSALSAIINIDYPGTFFVAPSIILGTVNINTVMNNFYLYDNKITDLTISAGADTQFSRDASLDALVVTPMKLTILNSFTVLGTNVNPIYIRNVPALAGTQHTISMASGTVNGDYLDIQDSNATGGATFRAGEHSVNSGNNTGWIWTYSASSSTDSLKRTSNSLAHSTDSNRRKATDLTHTTDADISTGIQTLTSVHTTDALLHNTVTQTHTTDSVKRSTGAITHATDANRKRSGVSVAHSTDSIKRSASVVNHTTDSNKKLSSNVAHTTDALKRSITAIVHATDSFLRRQIGVSHSTDANKIKTNNIVSHTTDALLRSGNELAHYTDANKRTTAQIAHSTDASKKIIYTIAHATDSLIRSVYTASHTTDTNKRSVTLVAHSTDTLKRTSNTASHSVDSNKRSESSISHLSDSFLRARDYIVHSTDSFLRKVNTLIHSTDSILEKTDTKSHSTDANKKTQGSIVAHASDSNKRKPITIAHATDSFLRITNSILHSTDAFLRKISSVSHATSSNKKSAGTSSHTTDSVLRESNQVAHSVDGFFKSRYVESHQTDAFIRRAYTATHTADANKRGAQLVSHGTDSWLFDANDVAHFTDSSLYIARGKKKLIVNGVWTYGVVKYNDGSGWRVVPVYYWNGSTWIETS